MKISIIGAGNMGGAIARGLASGSLVSAQDITVTARTAKTLEQRKAEIPGIKTSLDNKTAIIGADVIILAVEPHQLLDVCIEIEETVDFDKQTIVSIVAGINLAELYDHFGLTFSDDYEPEYCEFLGKGLKTVPSFFRVIPNTAISLKKSVNVISCSPWANEKQRAMVCGIFAELGTTYLIDEEKMAAATALTSCGIAYALKYIQTAIRGAVELGIPARMARDMVSETVTGAAAILQANNSFPEEEIYRVCTPGGITIKGLQEMNLKGFDNAVIAGLKRAAGKL